MFFLYISFTILLYVVLSFFISNAIYKFYKGNGRNSILKGFNDAYKSGLNATDTIIGNGIGLIISGFILSSLFSLLYFVAAMFVMYILFGV